MAANPTERIGFLLVPDFSLIAFASAIEPLRLANRTSNRDLYRYELLSDEVSGNSDVAAIGAVDIVGGQAVIADAEAAAGEQRQGGGSVHRIATGLMLTWVEPTYSGWPSTNRNSQALSRTRARLSISSRL